MTPEKAFYFYKGIGQPISWSSKSLVEFAEIVKKIDPSSVQFHVERGDFEAWFRMLGDVSLVGQVSLLRGKNIPANELRDRLGSTVELRIRQLQRIASEERQS